MPRTSFELAIQWALRLLGRLLEIFVDNSMTKEANRPFGKALVSERKSPNVLRHYCHKRVTGRDSAYDSEGTKRSSDLDDY